MTKKTKIGLILVPEHTNYGAQLQSFATQKAVESFGCDTEILIYRANKSNRNIKFYWGLIPWFINNLRTPKVQNRYKGLDENHEKNHQLRKAASKNFKETYLKNIRICNGYKELVQAGSSYNAVLIGSDQMWQPGVAFGNFISMRFVPKGVRRISYATSCGVSKYPKYCYRSAKDMWESFDFLSTREEQGKTIIQDVCGKDTKVEVLVDPTYLLSKQEWENYIPIQKKLDEPYVVCYLIGNDVEQKLCAKRYAQCKGLKLVSLMSNESVSEVDMDFADINVMGAGPNDFINWIRGAECVFTDSFHGLAFSVINEKQLYVFYRHKTGIAKTKNSRIDNIIKLWNIQNRLILDSNCNWEKYKEIPINYTILSKKVAEKRIEGLNYLKRALDFKHDNKRTI